MGGISIILVGDYFRKIENPLKKSQAKFVFLGLVIPNALGVLSQIIFSSLSIRFPDLTIPAVGFMCFLFAYGMMKYSLFSLTPITAADNILTLMTTEGTVTSIPEQVFDLVYSIDKSGTFIYISPSIEELSGYKRAELLGKKFYDFLEPEDVNKALVLFQELLIRSINGAKEWLDLELTFIKKDKSSFVLLTHSTPIVHSNEIYGIQGVAKDITSLKQAEIKQIELEKNRQAFIAITSHELRTPLNVLKGYTDFMQEQVDNLDTELMKKFFSTMSKNIVRLENLTQNISNLNRMDRASFKLTFQEFDLVKFLYNSVQGYFRFLGDQLEVDIPIGEVLIKGDPEKLQQVIDNLLDNAIKQTDEMKRKIQISMDSQENNVRILIADNGAGIASENIERIFEQFVNIETEYYVQGMGIGLYLSRLIVEAHGGDLTASSPGEGKGSTFSATIPIIET
jgi:PAS domain S-box-containing protein